MASHGRHGRRIEEKDWGRTCLEPDRLPEGRAEMKKIRGSSAEQEKKD